jgi:hypothetical protein
MEKSVGTHGCRTEKAAPACTNYSRGMCGMDGWMDGLQDGMDGEVSELQRAWRFVTAGGSGWLRALAGAAGLCTCGHDTTQRT